MLFKQPCGPVRPNFLHPPRGSRTATRRRGEVRERPKYISGGPSNTGCGTVRAPNTPQLVGAFSGGQTRKREKRLTALL